MKEEKELNPCQEVKQLKLNKKKDKYDGILRTNEEFELLLNGMSDLAILTQVYRKSLFKIIQINKPFLTMLGLSETKSNAAAQFFAEKNLRQKVDLWKLKAAEAVRESIDIHYEEHFRNEYYDLKLIPIISRQGICTHIITIGRNISDKKKVEEYRLQMEKLESIGLLAGGIAHDFNNILTVTMGNISLARYKLCLTESENTNEVIQLLVEAEKGAKQAKKITQQLLTFAKGGAPILKTCSIREVLMEMAAFSLRGSNSDYRFTIADDLSPVEIDVGQISQVLNNIIINASQAMPTGGTVLISAENVFSQPGNLLAAATERFVKISISDHGIGIPEEYLSKIFDPYFTTKQKGSGLGLATSYSIISKHGGTITVESDIGVGSTFNIYLKAAVKKEEAMVTRKKTESRKSGRILVMDDNDMLRDFLEEALDALGYEVSCAKDGQEAIEMIQNRPAVFDAAILDLTVPGNMGGKEAIREIRKFAPNLKAVVSSGYNNDPVIADYKNYGFDDFIIKPFNVEELKQVLRKVMY